MLLTDIGSKVKPVRGFTILEVLLVIGLAGVLVVGLCTFFLESISFVVSLMEKTEYVHQLRAGLEAMVVELHEADPTQLVLLELNQTEGKHTQIQFYKYNSTTLYWFYVNSSGSLIRAVQRPGYNWGRTTVASDIEQLYFTKNDQGLIQIELITLVNGSKMGLITKIFPGFD